MATFGNVGEFVQGQEPWDLYIERLEQYFEANEITSQDRQRAILIAVVGPSAFQLISKLLAPKKPKEINTARSFCANNFSHSGAG